MIYEKLHRMRCCMSVLRVQVPHTTPCKPITVLYRKTRNDSPFSSDPASQAPEYCLSFPALHHPCFQWKSYGQQEDHQTRWNIPRRSCHVSVGVGRVCLQQCIGYRIMLSMQVKVIKTMRRSRGMRAREGKRGDTRQLEQWSRISYHDTMVQYLPMLCVSRTAWHR
jgi:hypothetical protein